MSMECETAEDVRRLAREVAERRRTTFAPAPQAAMRLGALEAKIVALRPDLLVERMGRMEKFIEQFERRVGDLMRRLNEVEARLAPDRTVLPVNVRIKGIIDVVCKEYQFVPSEIMSHRRDPSLVEARHIAMVLAKRFTTASYPHIGRIFGGRDHSTVIHAVQKFEHALAQAALDLPSDASIADWVLALRVKGAASC